MNVKILYYAKKLKLLSYLGQYWNKKRNINGVTLHQGKQWIGTGMTTKY